MIKENDDSIITPKYRSTSQEANKTVLDNRLPAASSNALRSYYLRLAVEAAP